MPRHSKMCPGYHGQPSPIIGSRCSTRPTERRVPPPPPTPRLTRLVPHPIGHLAGRQRLTWWWVTPISPVSPISAPLPPFASRDTQATPLAWWGVAGAHLCSRHPPLSPPSLPPLSPPSPFSVSPNLSHHTAMVEAVGWATVGD